MDKKGNLMTWTLVTGGAKRLGAVICRTLAEQGHNIVVHYHTSHKEALDIVASCQHFGVKAECIQGDFSSTKSTLQFTQNFLTRFSNVENLINNAGNYLIKAALDTPAEAWYELFQVNFHAPTTLIQVLTPALKQAQGNIINIGVSGINTLRANHYSTAYSMTKTCLLMLTKSLAKELASSNVRVNMVSPGQLDISIDKPTNPMSLPMQRFGTSEEVAQVVAFLLKKGQYITGQNIEVAGGFGL
jgi:NAD(P)-dependent dehydrogenase (short-subunit alcohol dehydrogenase family)